MKKTIYCLLALLLAIGCGKKEKLTFETLQLDEGDCENCPVISIKIPKALDDKEISRAINTALEEEIIVSLALNEASTAPDMARAVTSFISEYQEMRVQFPEMASLGEWEAKINAEVIFENPLLVTIKMDTYSYTGGAHGYDATSFLNFDIEKGTEIDNEQLFNDLDGFLTVAESMFRKQEKIPEDAQINATGFMFAGNEFHLSDNLGFIDEGVQMVYNQYEVASYADGPIELTLPYAEVNSFLKAPYRIK